LTGCGGGRSGHGLGSDHGEEPELAGGIAAGRGSIGNDSQVAADGGEHVTVEGQRPDLGVMDGFAVGLVGADRTGVP